MYLRGRQRARLTARQDKPERPRIIKHKESGKKVTLFQDTIQDIADKMITEH
jgi:hypothetical protein